MIKTYFTLFFCTVAYLSFGQKLPEIQKQALISPANIKIDGKLNEWPNSFEAENKRTEIFYSISNDTKNLYLILKSSSLTNTTKILTGGITFTINLQGKKSEKESQSITYPLVKRAERVQGARPAQGGFQNRAQQTVQQRDSLNLIQRKNQLATVKELKVLGFKNITDTLISIYNEYGLKAVGAFDEAGNYVCEIAIPLNQLGLSTDFAMEFAYQIKINGQAMNSFGGRAAPAGGGGNFGGGARGGAGGGIQISQSNSMTEMASPTSFWGKYNLISTK